jgi:hypothetical protein
MFHRIVRSISFQERVNNFDVHFPFRICKHHFGKAVRRALQKELKNTYRAPDKAYASMDFSGRGFILEEDFLASIVIQRL